MGKDKRYSFENYIFDPILITGFLLRAKFPKVFTDEENILKENENFTDIKTFNNQRLQFSIIDFFINKMKIIKGDIALHKYVRTKSRGFCKKLISKT